MSNFNPNSFDAQVATILQKLEDMRGQQAEKREEDKVAFTQIMNKQDYTNGRVTGLETREQYAKGKVAGIALAVSGIVTLIGIYFSH